MAYFFVIGNTLVPPAEYETKLSSGEMERFRTDLTAQRKAHDKDGGTTKSVALEFTTGRVTHEQILTARRDAALDLQPTGIGKPLSIEIVGIYTGDASSSALGQKPDLLVASAVKSLVTYDAAPRAINQLIRNVKDETYYPLSALNQGSPIVYYTPSLADETLVCSFELLVENFTSHSAFVISKLMAAAGGLPVFAPASVYLIAGAEIVKIAGDLGKLVLQKKPFLRDDLNLHFATPGVEPSVAHAAVIYNQRDEAELMNLKVQKMGKQSRVRLALVDAQTGEEYGGTAPYVIVVIDGRLRPDLNSFSPRLATAALLERFYQASGEADGKLDEIFSAAMELYNDYTFRMKAEDFKNQIGTLDPTEPTYTGEKLRLEKLMAACKGNIRSEVFNPRFPSVVEAFSQKGQNLGIQNGVNLYSEARLRNTLFPNEPSTSASKSRTVTLTFNLNEALTPALLRDVIAPDLCALSDLQQIINDLQQQPNSTPRLQSVSSEEISLIDSDLISLDKKVRH